MYAEYYGFRELPFNITPDPRFLYLNECYQEALAALAYGIDARKGFITLIGEAGTGKTTLLRRMLDTLDPKTKTVLLLNPTVSFDEILEHILCELGIPTDAAGKLTLLQRLNEYLLEHTLAGGNVVLLIDEAQDLKTATIEELRLLSNLETAREKILQIVLTGQPELEGILRNPALRQLRQRVALHVRVRPLTPPDVAAYIRTRLDHAGAPDLELFTPEALARIAALSRGIPRLVNVLCDAALLTAFVAGTRPVTPRIVETAWADYASDEVPAAEPAPPPPTPQPPPAPDTVLSPPPVRIILPPTQEPAPRPTPEPAPPAVATSPEAHEVSVLVTTVGVPPAPQPPAELPPQVFASRFLPRPRPPVQPPPAWPPPLPEPPVAARSTFSIPAAAALVGVLAMGVYGVSLHEDRLDQAEDAVAAAPADPIAGSNVAAAVAATPPAPPDPLPARGAVEGPVSAGEAADVVEQFRTAYEQRDIDRLLALFADDAIENGRHGIDAIRASYEATLARLDDVHYLLPSVAVAAGARADVRAPFVISYAQAGGGRAAIRGDAEWELERRDGRPRIVSLSYRLQPEG